jgi:hypothetical protein
MPRRRGAIILASRGTAGQARERDARAVRPDRYLFRVSKLAVAVGSAA